MRNYALLFSFLFLFVVTDLDAQRRSGRASKRVDESKNVENVKPDELHKKYGFSSRDQMVEFLLEKDLKRSDKRIVEKYGKGKKLSKSQARKFESLLKQYAGERAVSESSRSGRVSGDRALSSRGSSSSRAKSRGRSGRVSGDRALSGSGRGSSASRAPSRGRSGRQAADDMGMEHDSSMTPVMHLLGGLDGFLNDKVADNKLDSDQVQPMMELANNLETATHSEWESEDNAGAAGAAMEAAEQYLNDNNIEQGVIDHFMQMLCMLEWEVHAEHQEGPPEEGPDCGMEMEDDYTDADYDCDPNGDYPQMDPGPDGGCADYADCNGNGAFDVGEPCYEGGQGPSFDEVDANNDGEISYSEAQAVFGQEPDFDAQFNEVDQNNNGSVNMDEWEDAGPGDEEHDGSGDHGNMDDGMDHGNMDDGMDHGNMDDGMDHGNMDDEGLDCDPDGDYPQMDPGPNGGCSDYADCNGNGVFDVGEPCYEGENQGPTFDEVDANGDGEISYSEAQAVFGQEPDFDERFNEADSNNDGKVDMTEWEDAGPGDDDGDDGQ
jgi:hypothetical protein